MTARSFVVSADPKAVRAAADQLAAQGLDVQPAVGPLDQFSVLVVAEARPAARAVAIAKAGLNPRHVGLLDGFAAGKTYEQMGRARGISGTAQRQYAKRLFRAWRVDSREEAVLVACRLGVLDGSPP